MSGYPPIPSPVCIRRQLTTHTHSLQVPTASQKPGRKRVHFLFQHKSAPNSDL